MVDQPLAALFKALADRTRLAVVERLSIRPAAASELARPFAMALPSFMQHLGVLEDAGVVTSHKTGRTRVYQLAPDRFGPAADWLSTHRNHWQRQTDRLDAVLLASERDGATMSDYTPNPDLDLVLERTIAVAPDRVWAAWTEPELILQWFTPAPWKTVACDIDVRPGGRSIITMESPEGERFPNAGCYLVVDPDRLLVWTSVMAEGFRPVSPSNGAEDLPFTGRIEIAPAPGGGTHYRAIAIHPDEDGRRRHAEMGFHEGWGAALDQLVALMS